MMALQVLLVRLPRAPSTRFKKLQKGQYKKSSSQTITTNSIWATSTWGLSVRRFLCFLTLGLPWSICWLTNARRTCALKSKNLSNFRVELSRKTLMAAKMSWRTATAKVVWTGTYQRITSVFKKIQRIPLHVSMEPPSSPSKKPQISRKTNSVASLD